VQLLSGNNMYSYLSQLSKINFVYWNSRNPYFSDTNLNSSMKAALTLIKGKGYLNDFNPKRASDFVDCIENKIDSFLVHDLSLRKILKVSSGELKLNLALINILDESAPRLYDAPDFSFDTRVHDPRGRMLGVNIEYKF